MTLTLPATRTAPFLVWPVARREFYRAIAIAMLPTFAWAMIIFGWRVLGMLVGASLAATLAHWTLKRFTTRGKLLVFPHSLVTAWVFVALAQPQWPIWIVSITALLIPLALWLVGGPGRERLHVAILAVLALQLVILPILHNEPASQAILAKDRLLMGDIRDQIPVPLYQWPRSSEIGGNDAAALALPAQIATDTLGKLSHALAPPKDAPPVFIDNTITPAAEQEARSIINDALGRLPGVELFLLGITPGRAGAVSLIGLVWGGLYLAYRYILRPRSVYLFLICYTLAAGLIALWPAFFGHGHLSILNVWHIWTTFPGEIVTLLIYTVLGSDVFFAALIILALPGTEPLTARGRQIFLIIAALLAAFLARADLPLPTATLAILILMPLAPTFDHYFAKRSWLNRVRL